MTDGLKGQDKRQDDLVDQKGAAPTSEVDRRRAEPKPPLPPHGVDPQQQSPGQPAGGE